MTPAEASLLGALRRPETVLALDTAGWNVLLREARRLDLSSRLAVSLGDRDGEPPLPDKVREHLAGARAVAAQHERIVRWEVDRIRHALRDLELSPVLLKGAAYLLAGLPPARGRLVGDVDILVPESRIQEVERALLEGGWEPVKLDPYDQRYYRTWMHELPPLRHRERRIVVDVHHRILPRTGKLHPDPRKLLEGARQVGADGTRVLCPEDMVLHGAAHLFQDGDLAGGLRDLLDLDDLLRCFSGRDPGFWDRLAARGRDLGLGRPLFYALRFSSSMLGTPVPDESRFTRDGRPPWPLTPVMDALATRALLPDESGKRGVAAARWLLYVRSHWLRMPFWLLGSHLTRKFFHRLVAHEA